MTSLVNNFDAQKGRNGGATIDVYTKSGSNQFHGNVDYYFTNNDLSATTHFSGSTLPSSTRNEVSAAMGGPIWKNKLFWFGAYDVLRSSVASAYTQTVETQDFLTWAKTNLPNNIGTQILATAPPQNYPTAGIVHGVQLSGLSRPMRPGTLPATTPRRRHSFNAEHHWGRERQLQLSQGRVPVELPRRRLHPQERPSLC